MQSLKQQMDVYGIVCEWRKRGSPKLQQRSSRYGLKRAGRGQVVGGLRRYVELSKVHGNVFNENIYAWI